MNSVHAFVNSHHLMLTAVSDEPWCNLSAAAWLITQRLILDLDTAGLQRKRFKAHPHGFYWFLGFYRVLGFGGKTWVL